MTFCICTFGIITMLRKGLEWLQQFSTKVHRIVPPPHLSILTTCKPVPVHPSHPLDAGRAARSGQYQRTHSLPIYERSTVEPNLDSSTKHDLAYVWGGGGWLLCLLCLFQRAQQQRKYKYCHIPPVIYCRMFLCISSQRADINNQIPLQIQINSTCWIMINITLNNLG